MNDAVLISSAVLALIEQLGDHHLTEVTPAATFPDGSILLTNQGDCDFVRFEILATGIARQIAMSYGQTFPLFPPAFPYVLLYPQHYAARPGELRFVAGSAALPTITQDIHNPVDVLVEWKAKSPSKMRIAAYVEHLNTWQDSVRNGTCGEGPATLVCDHIEHCQRYAWFRVDVSKAGPLTMIWLILSHLSFGINVNVVRSLYFNTRPEFDPRVIHGLKGEKVGL